MISQLTIAQDSVANQLTVANYGSSSVEAITAMHWNNMASLAYDGGYNAGMQLAQGFADAQANIANLAFAANRPGNHLSSVGYDPNILNPIIDLRVAQYLPPTGARLAGK